MKKSISIKAIIILSVFFFNIESSYALDPTDPDETEDGVGETPINDYIVPMLVAGVGLAYVLTKKQIKRA